MDPQNSSHPQLPQKDWRGLILIGVLILILIIGIAKAVSINSKKSITQIPDQNGGPVVTQAVLPTGGSSPGRISKIYWVAYQGTHASFWYPSSWLKQEFAGTHNDKGVIVRMPPGEASFTFFKETDAPTDHPEGLQTVMDMYTNGLRFQKSTVTIASNEATLLQGPVELDSADGKKRIVIETVAYIVRPDITYTLAYEYPGAKVDPQYADLFSKILSSLSLSQ